MAIFFELYTAWSEPSDCSTLSGFFSPITDNPTRIWLKIVHVVCVFFIEEIFWPPRTTKFEAQSDSDRVTTIDFPQQIAAAFAGSLFPNFLQLLGTKQ